MTLEQLKIFVEAARAGSFTLAAGKLGLTQSAVSLSIRKLEEEMELSLFRRSGTGPALTDAGQVLFAESRRILDDIALTVRRVQSMRNPRRNRLVIGCSRNAYDCWMPDILSRLEDRDDISALDVVVGCADDVTAWVMRGTVDLGLAERAPGHPQLAYWEVFTDTLRLYASTGLAARLSPVPDWQALENLGPLLWEAETDLARCLLRNFVEHKLNARRLHHESLRLTSGAAVLCAVLAGRYPGFLNSKLAHAHVASGLLQEVGDLEVAVPYWLFGPRHGDIEAIARTIAEAAAQAAPAGSPRPGLSLPA